MSASAILAGDGQMTMAAAHRAFLQASGLQRDFSPMPAPKPPPAWIETLIHVLIAAAPVLKIVFWIAVAVGGAILLWVVVRDLPFATAFRRRSPAKRQPDWTPGAASARALLGEADQLALAGRFEDAIHLLLFRSIEDLAVRRPGAVRASFTSRDIVEAAPLSDAGRAAFQVIMQAVEHSFFAGRPAGRDEFDRCRSQYKAFALAEGA